MVNRPETRELNNCLCHLLWWLDTTAAVAQLALCTAPLVRWFSRYLSAPHTVLRLGPGLLPPRPLVAPSPSPGKSAKPSGDIGASRHGSAVCVLSCQQGGRPSVGG